MLRAALSYVDSGWPIVPGATPQAGAGRVRILSGGRSMSVDCSCRSKDCFSPAAHPMGPDWADQHVTTKAAARFWWDHEDGPVPNIVLCCGQSFDVWSVPAAVGSAVLDLVDSGAVPLVPVAITSLRWWHFFTAPTLPGQGMQVPHGLEVVHLGDGRFVPAPPSTRGAAGPDRWLVEHRHRLPTGWSIAAAMILIAERFAPGPGSGGVQRARSH